MSNQPTHKQDWNQAIGFPYAETRRMVDEATKRFWQRRGRKDAPEASYRFNFVKDTTDSSTPGKESIG